MRRSWQRDSVSSAARETVCFVDALAGNLALGPRRNGTQPASSAQKVGCGELYRCASTVGVKKRARAAIRLRCVVPVLQTAVEALNVPREEKGTAKVQAMDFATIAAVLAEISDSVVPSKLETVFQVSASKLALGLRTQEKRWWLYLCWHASYGHVALSEQGPANNSSARNAKATKEDQNYSLSATLRALLAGQVLARVGVSAPYERVLKLEFAPRPAEQTEWVLYLELFGGGRSNLVLVDQAGSIRACGRQVSVKRAQRPLQVGAEYQPLVPASTPDPTNFMDMHTWKQHLIQLGTGSVFSRTLVRCFSGVSPSLANAMLMGTGIHPRDTLTEHLSEEQWNLVFSHWSRWLALLSGGALSNARYSPVELPDIQAERAGFKYCVDTFGLRDAAGVDANSSEQGAPVSALVGKYYGAFERVEEFERVRRSVCQRLDAVQKKVDSRIAGFEARMKDAAEIDELRTRADKILSFAHEWTAGDTRLTYRDTQGAEELIEIPTDCTDVVAFATSLHKQSSKLARAVDKVVPLLEESRLDRDYLDHIRWAVSDLTARTEAELHAMREIETEVLERLSTRAPGGIVRNARPDEAMGSGGEKKSLKKQTVKKASGKAKQANKAKASSGGVSLDDFLTVPIPVWVNNEEEAEERLSSSGSKFVIVGRNNRQNDAVSFRLARSSDIWFHATVPGAHVLLRMSSGDAASAREIEFAASVAAYFSRARDAGDVAVVYCSPKNLRRAGAPGMVTFSNEKQTRGRPMLVRDLVEQQMLAA
ncbi:protein YloA [Porphyridium purpureum]|uniref:Protein YloA n=1 Tax=Porphyridium purpureum TaxID=35688 RepID=A0A5J4YW12_PORPP|nr:protein YloA [Porphyridium purpureum]|eukprot:POR7440..scf227_4